MNKGVIAEKDFVAYILNICAKDKRPSAMLRRAESLEQSHLSWEYLIRVGINIENDKYRLSHSFIASAIAKAKITKDGDKGLGETLFIAEKGNLENNTRLRRLISCSDLNEVIVVLRHVLSFINSKELNCLCYSDLLKDLLDFPIGNDYSSEYLERVKARWARGYFKSLHGDSLCI
jgi:CRISPR type I-E-associated protein CasB/Cse2